MSIFDNNLKASKCLISNDFKLQCLCQNVSKYDCTRMTRSIPVSMSQLKENISVPILNSLPFQGTVFKKVLSPEMGSWTKKRNPQSHSGGETQPMTLKIGSGGFSNQLVNDQFAEKHWNSKNGMFFGGKFSRSNRIRSNNPEEETSNKHRNYKHSTLIQKTASVLGNQLLQISSHGQTRHPRGTGWDCGCLSTSEKANLSRIHGDGTWSTILGPFGDSDADSTNRCKW